MPRPPKRITLAPAFVFIAAAICFTTAPVANLRAADPTIQPPGASSGDASLLDLIAQRLDLAREVAWTKFQSGAPISDPERESALIHSLAEKATQAGFSPAATTAFFTAQIAASRQLQAELIEGWKKGAARPAAKPLDLKAAIRPRLDVVSQQMLIAFLARPEWLNSPVRLRAARKYLRSRGFSVAVASLATPHL